MGLPTTSVFVSACLLAAAATCHASPVYSQAPLYPGGALFASESTAGEGILQCMFDDFRVTTAATVDRIAWDGGYFFGATPTQPIVGFIVGVYADEGGAPGALLGQSAITGSANETPTGTDLVGYSSFAYHAPLTTAFVAEAATTYWLSIMAATGDEIPYWGWRTSAVANGLSYFERPPLSGNRFSTPTDFSFALFSSEADASVPEPSTLLLVGPLGFVLGWVATTRGRRGGGGRGAQRG